MIRLGVSFTASKLFCAPITSASACASAFNGASAGAYLLSPQILKAARSSSVDESAAVRLSRRRLRMYRPDLCALTGQAEPGIALSARKGRSGASRHGVCRAVMPWGYFLQRYNRRCVGAGFYPARTVYKRFSIRSIPCLRARDTFPSSWKSVLLRCPKISALPHGGRLKF